MENEILPRGRIQNVGALNLLAAKSPEDFAAIESISNVGVVLVPRGLAMAAATIPMENVGTIAPIPEGEDVVLISGQTTTTGEALAAGDPERTLVIVGQVFIETVVTKVGYRGIHVIGQVFAPRGSEAALGAALREVTGQILYAPEGARMVLNDDIFDREFLEALPRPTPFLVLGDLEFADDIDVELLRRTIPEIVLFGDITTPKALAATLKVLSVQKFGDIVVKG